MAFDVRSLRPGDEVGITWTSLGGRADFVSRVTRIDEDGCIEVEGRELPFWPDDGREMELVFNGVVAPCPNGTRLCEPTDAGRKASLASDLEWDFDSLGAAVHRLPLEQLRRIKTEVDRIASEHGVQLRPDDEPKTLEVEPREVRVELVVNVALPAPASRETGRVSKRRKTAANVSVQVQGTFF